MSDAVEKLRKLEQWIRNPEGKSFTLASDIFDEAADEIERLLKREARLREVLEDHIRAAECIRHWHDAFSDSSGMVVSAEHVRLLWSATSRARTALGKEK